MPIFVLLLLWAPALNAESVRTYREWRAYGGGPENIQYSALDQINRKNVHRLKVAWSFDTGDAYSGSEMQCNPIVIDGVLFATTPRLRVIALDAATGKLHWSFDPHEGPQTDRLRRNRGVTWWSDGRQERLFFVSRNFLFALDARSGKPIPDFGDRGRVDLREGLGRDPETISISATTPGVIYNDLLILGSILSEALPSPPGDIRAYDVRTGELRWSFHTIPHPGELGYETWPKDAWKYSGGANNWAGMSLDEERGLLFVPTGSAAFDFYGANRLGDNLFANSLIALKAETGERVWHFQAVKHDVWDRDFPAPPRLVTVKRDGDLIDAAAQITKSGHVFVFERETGKPLFPIEYRKVPASDVDGEKLAATQPLPLKPPPFARQIFTEDMVTKRTPEAHEAVLKRFRQVRGGEQFTPPSLQGTILFPGYDGGGEWGGSAFDPATAFSMSTLTKCPGSSDWRSVLSWKPERPRGTCTSITAPAVMENSWAVTHPSFPPSLPSGTGLSRAKSHRSFVKAPGACRRLRTCRVRRFRRWCPISSRVKTQKLRFRLPRPWTSSTSTTGTTSSSIPTAIPLSSLPGAR